MPNTVQNKRAPEDLPNALTAGRSGALSKRSFYIIASLSWLVVLATFRFFLFPIELVGPTVAHHVPWRPAAFFGHIGFASLALLILPFQLSQNLRVTRLALHRWLGRVYGVSILIGGISGLMLAMTTSEGPVAAVGFAILAVLWLLVTARAVLFAITGDIPAHKRWMIRSAALTLAAVTLRLQLPVAALSVGIETGYPFIAWSCWVPNVLFAEWLIRRAPRRGAGLHAA